ncbi:unnamed protein product [Calicophoron daubneyi]|uniref:Uncharacterized protein n=1 Tax=Calicophoron daubneyi TaxID=300641 RepID=A0AAV2TTH1_CALDB
MASPREDGTHEPSREEGADYEALPASVALYHHMLAGACAGVMEHVLMYPVDSVKTRMQCLRSLHGPRYKNVVHGLMQLIRTEGFRSSLRGIGAVIGGAGPAHAAYFGCYEQTKSVISKTPLGPTPVTPMIGGMCATVLHDAVMTPTDAVKQRLQLYNSPYHNTLDCLRRVCATEGLGTLYRAYFTQLTMNLPFGAIYFASYELTQDMINPKRKYRPWTHLAAGGLAGSLAAAFTTPLDVCKTMLNTQDRQLMLTVSSKTDYKETHPQSLLGVARQVYHLEGLRGFMRGVGARILSAAPATAISWCVYEYFKWYLRGSPLGFHQKPESETDEDSFEHPSSTRVRSLMLTVSSEASCLPPNPPTESVNDSS